MKILIASTIFNETKEQIALWYRHIQSAFVDYEVEIVFLTEKPVVEIQARCDSIPATLISIPPEMPIFLRFQKMVDLVLQSTSDYLVKTDIDAIFLGFKKPDELSFIEGQWLRYNREHQQARWRWMPQQWQKQNPHFHLVPHMDSVHGGCMILRKDLCQAIEPLFWRDQIEWNVKHVENRDPRESFDSQTIVREEQMLAWYLYQLSIRIQGPDITTGVDKDQKYYYTYRAEIQKLKPTVLVFHPIKTEEAYRELMVKVQSFSQAKR